MPSDEPHEEKLLDLARLGDRQALGALFVRHRDRLGRMVQLRMDQRMKGRLDTADVMQEIFLEFARSLPDYLCDPTWPFFIWLRTLAGRKLHALHRQHLGTRMRDARREVSLHSGPLPQASSVFLAAQLLGRLTTPSHAAIRAEQQIRIQDALNGMDPIDREVLALRHFEQLSNSETALILGLSETGASNRFVRALRRLKQILTSLSPEGGTADDRQRRRPRPD